MVYCTKDQYAQMKHSASWAAYLLTGKTYPAAEELDLMLNRMTANMNRVIETTDDVTDSAYAYQLMDICYRGEQMMEDEEQSRGQQRAERINYQPRDYIYERDRNWLEWLGVIKGNRIVGGVSS